MTCKLLACHEISIVPQNIHIIHLQVMKCVKLTSVDEHIGYEEEITILCCELLFVCNAGVLVV